MRRFRPPLPPETRAAVTERDEHRCVRCGRTEGAGPGEAADLNVAHVVPWIKSRSHEPGGLRVLCWPCHEEWDKMEAGQLMTFDEWLRTRPADPEDVTREPAGFLVSVRDKGRVAQLARRRGVHLSEMFRQLVAFALDSAERDGIDLVTEVSRDRILRRALHEAAAREGIE